MRVSPAGLPDTWAAVADFGARKAQSSRCGRPAATPTPTSGDCPVACGTWAANVSSGGGCVGDLCDGGVCVLDFWRTFSPSAETACKVARTADAVHDSGMCSIRDLKSGIGSVAAQQVKGSASNTPQ